MKMRTSKNYKCLLTIFKEESDRLKKCAASAKESETVSYYSHMHLYLCALCTDIAAVTLNSREKELFFKRVQECSSKMCATVGEFYVKSYEKAKGE